MVDQTAPEVPESNRTALGLYVWPTDAYAMWKADPENVHVLDVRTFEEYVFVGHFEFAKNIPLVVLQIGRSRCPGDQGAGHGGVHERLQRPRRDGGQPGR